MLAAESKAKANVREVANQVGHDSLASRPRQVGQSNLTSMSGHSTRTASGGKANIMSYNRHLLHSADSANSPVHPSARGGVHSAMQQASDLYHARSGEKSRQHQLPSHDSLHDRLPGSGDKKHHSVPSDGALHDRLPLSSRETASTDRHYSYGDGSNSAGTYSQQSQPVATARRRGSLGQLPRLSTPSSIDIDSPGGPSPGSTAYSSRSRLRIEPRHQSSFSSPEAKRGYSPDHSSPGERLGHASDHSRVSGRFRLPSSPVGNGQHSKNITHARVPAPLRDIETGMYTDPEYPSPSTYSAKMPNPNRSPRNPQKRHPELVKKQRPSWIDKNMCCCCRRRKSGVSATNDGFVKHSRDLPHHLAFAKGNQHAGGDYGATMSNDTYWKFTM